MSLNEAKERLHILIEQVEDMQLLKAYSDLIQREIEKAEMTALDPATLPPAIREVIQKSISESKIHDTDAVTYLNSLRK